jgi:hypothetical protein
MGKYTNPDIIQDPLAKALAQTSKDVGKAAIGYIAAEENKRKLDELRKNKLNEDLYSIDQAVNSIPSSEDEVFDDNFKAMLKEELTNVNKLGMQAIKSGNNSEYLKAKSSFESLVKQMPGLISNIDNQAKQLSEKSEGSVLDNTDVNYVKFLQNWSGKNGSGIKPKIVNGKLIMDYNGFNVNTGSVFKNVEKGGGLSFVTDPSKDMETIWKAEVGGNYEDFKETRTKINKGELSKTSTKVQDYTEANIRAKEELTGIDRAGNPIKDWVDPFQDMYNQNKWQWYTKGQKGVFDGSDAQKQELRELMVNNMIGSLGSPSLIEESSTSYDSSEIDKEKRYLKSLKTSAANVLKAGTLSAKAEMLFQELTQYGVKDVRNKYTVVDGKLYEWQGTGKTKAKPSTASIDLNTATNTEISEFINSQSTSGKMSGAAIYRATKKGNAGRFNPNP